MKKMQSRIICGQCWMDSDEIHTIIENEYNNFVCPKDKNHQPFIQIFEWKEVEGK